MTEKTAMAIWMSDAVCTRNGKQPAPAPEIPRGLFVYPDQRWATRMALGAPSSDAVNSAVNSSVGWPMPSFHQL